MSSSLGSTAFVVFTVLSVITLKELNVQVTEPYMVRSRSYTCYHTILMPLRTSPFMSHRSRHTATGTGPTGIRKSRHLPDCETIRLFLAYADLLALSYVLTILLKKIFVFKCRLPTLRLTPLLTLLFLPLATTRLLRYHQRMRPPPSFLTPTLDSVVLSTFPIAWFFGFLYYTEVPSLLSVIITIVAASQGRHWIACMVRAIRAL